MFRAYKDTRHLEHQNQTLTKLKRYLLFN